MATTMPMATRTAGASHPRSSEYLRKKIAASTSAMPATAENSFTPTSCSQSTFSRSAAGADVRSRHMSRGGGGSIGGAIGGAGEGGFSARGGSGGIVGGDGGEGTTTGGGGVAFPAPSAPADDQAAATGLGADGGARGGLRDRRRRGVLLRQLCDALFEALDYASGPRVRPGASTLSRSALCRTRLTIGSTNGSDATISARRSRRAACRHIRSDARPSAQTVTIRRARVTRRAWDVQRTLEIGCAIDRAVEIGSEQIGFAQIAAGQDRAVASCHDEIASARSRR